jgi:aspartyl-tRNA(Asn)/glutamyl-tRNA(Gln) amidotransferase subunit A
VAGLRIAFSPTLGYATANPEIASLVAAAAKLFESLGAHVELANPGIDDPIGCFIPHWYGGTAHSVRNYSKKQLGQLDPGLREIVTMGQKVTLNQYYDAVEARIALGIHMKKFHEKYDLLLTPTMPIPAFETGRELPPGSTAERWMSWSPFTYPFNLTQQPAASVPCGFTRAGLPAGLQIIGRMHDDATVLRAARAYEIERPFEMPRVPRVTHGG